MKKFPLLWFTPLELIQTAREYAEAGISHKLNKAFRTAEAKLKTQLINGKDPSAVSAGVWVCGFIKNDLLNEETSETRLSRTREGAYGNTSSRRQ